MANTIVTPATMSLNGYVYGNSTSVGSTACIVNPTTAVTYQITMPVDGKVGLLFASVFASSSSFIRVQVGNSASSDYLGWQGGAGYSTDVKTFYMPYSSANFGAAASSTEYLILGPFETAKYGRLSTSGNKVMNVTVDAAGTQVPQSSLSTTFSITVSTIKMMAFQMP
jgi:hypothetical protein